MICRTCKKDKKKDQFVLKNKITGTRSTQCKSCQREYAKSHYINNKDKYVQRAKKFSSNARQKAIQFVLEYLEGKSCIKCGEDDILVLDFHHRDPSNKKYVVSLMISRNCVATIQEELDKCDILCANCHRKETHKQQNTYKYQHVQKKFLAGP